MEPSPLERILIRAADPAGPRDATPADVTHDRHRWTLEQAALLGLVPDGEVAEFAGVSPHTVLKERILRGIPPFRIPGDRIEWTERKLARLGRNSDRMIGFELGIGEAVVFVKRNEMNIPSFYPDYGNKRRRWSAEELELLGKAPDQVVADAIGAGFTTVRRKRKSLNIPPWGRVPKKIDWKPEMEADIGPLSDLEVALKYGICERSVADHRTLVMRRRRGRIAFVWTDAARERLKTHSDKVNAKHFRCPVGQVRVERERLGIDVKWEEINWTPEMVAKLGKFPDAQIGREHGISHGAVALERDRRGISKWVDPRIRPWTTEDDALHGTVSDREVSRITGRDIASVHARRKELGIPSMTEQKKAWRKSPS
jgi:hypothetical protein